jgi:hypothetical protein
MATVWPISGLASRSAAITLLMHAAMMSSWARSLIVNL